MVALASAGPILLEPVAVDLGDQILAGPFAAGTVQDGSGQYDQCLACQSRHLETADGQLWGGLSGDGLQRDGSETRVLAPRLQSAVSTVWVA